MSLALFRGGGNAQAARGESPRSDVPAPIAYEASDQVRALIAGLGRTEDLRLSPSGRRLAVAAAVRNRIAIFDLDIAAAGAPRVTLLHGFEFAAACLGYPHGLDFVDDETLLVASRKGNVALFKLPPVGTHVAPGELAPLRILRQGEVPHIDEPGSLALLSRDLGPLDLLICNNAGHSITRHRLGGADYALADSDVLIDQWLDLPDGLCVSADGAWIAVSNHNALGVMLYRNAAGFEQSGDPEGILRGVRYPHGLRFAPDGRHLFVADAGGPYVHVFTSDARDWRGVRHPIASLRIMDAATFERGRYNAREGGPKGVDIDPRMRVLVTTSEWQPLSFFDAPAMLRAAELGGHLPQLDGADDAATHAADIRYELDAAMQVSEIQDRLRQARTQAREAEREARRAAKRARKAEDRLAAMRRSLSWRVTAPLRWARDAWQRFMRRSDSSAG